MGDNMIKNKNLFLAFSIIGFLMIPIVYLMGDIKLIILDVVLSVIVFFLFIIALIMSKDENKVYDSKYKDIFNTYGEILIKSTKLPSFSKRNLVIIDNIEDLIKSQKEIRKPIYYCDDLSSCTFILLDSKEALVYILKKNEDVVAEIDAVIKSRLKKIEKGKPETYNIFEGLERTTIIKVGDMSYNISPIRDTEIPKKK